MTVSSSATFPKQAIIYWICYGTILLVALLFRVLPIRSGLPYSDYIDEGHVLHQTIDAFNHKNLDVHWYGLPALPAYSAGAALIVYSPLYRHFHGHRFQKDLPPDRAPSSNVDYDLITPVELFVAGRAVTACLSLASVIVAGMIAARLANERTRLVAMLLVAVCPALVTRASIVIVDTFAAFFVLVTLYLCLRIKGETSKFVWRDVILAGLATGLVFASKYPIASVGVAVLTIIVALQWPWLSRLRLMALAAFGLALGILLGAPMTFFMPVTVWHDVVENIRAYRNIHSPQGYIVQVISMSELGLPLLFVGFAGIVVMLRKRETRTVALSWILFAAVLIALFANSSFRPFRSFLSLVPLLCIAGAIAFSGVIDWARARNIFSWRLVVAFVLLGGCAGSLGFSSFQQVERRMIHRDSRIQAVDWLQQHALKGQTILALRNLAVLPTEWERIPAKVTIVPWQEALEILKQQRFDYIVAGEFDLRHSGDIKALSEYRELWKAGISNLTVQAQFGTVDTPVVPFVWHTNDERILILSEQTTLTEGFEQIPK